MKNFPYRDEDLITKDKFIKFCSSRKYKINEEFLNFLDENSLLSPAKDSNYSEFQFYLIKEIIDKRYDPYFYRTYFTYNSNGEKFAKETLEHSQRFDKIYREKTYPSFIRFFNIYYDIAEDFLRTKQTIRVRPTQKNIDTIKYFIERYQIEYDKYISIYRSLLVNTEIKKIPEFKIVMEFVSRILVVIEWYFVKNNIPYKRKIKGQLIGKYTESCFVCGKFFQKGRVTQVCCSPQCTKQWGNLTKNRKRKTNKSYGA